MKLPGVSAEAWPLTSPTSQRCVIPRCNDVPMKLFISSLISGYEAERAAVAQAATVLRWDVIRAEDFGARPDTPRRACLEAVRAADVVILVMGADYGAIQDGGLSPTHEEWREATKSQKPTLVFVQTVDARDQLQQAFLEEVQGWSAGRFRESFGSPQELRDKVTRALADLRAPGLADESEVSQRAVAALPEAARGMFGSGSRLDVAVAGGPRQQVLRPAEIESGALITDLHREAMFGPNAVLDSQAATKPGLSGGHLVIAQDSAEVAIRADGTILISRSAMSSRSDLRTVGIPSIVEEEVRERIAGALRFAFDVLDRIDPSHRITDVVAAAALRDAGHTPWRTRAEVAANPGSASMPMGNGDSRPVTLDPPMVRRAALVHEADRIAEDLAVLLRRQHR